MPTEYGTKIHMGPWVQGQWKQPGRRWPQPGGGVFNHQERYGDYLQYGHHITWQRVRVWIGSRLICSFWLWSGARSHVHASIFMCGSKHLPPASQYSMLCILLCHTSNPFRYVSSLLLNLISIGFDQSFPLVRNTQAVLLIHGHYLFKML